MEAFSLWLADIVSQLGYTEIVFLMALESSLFPVPSELVMIPAGYRAAQGELNPFLATLAGGGGSMIGASANYVLGKYLGRAFLLRYGKYFLISKKTFDDAEPRNVHWQIHSRGSPSHFDSSGHVRHGDSALCSADIVGSHDLVRRPGSARLLFWRASDQGGGGLYARSGRDCSGGPAGLRHLVRDQAPFA